MAACVDKKIELNNLNAEIKKIYQQVKRSNSQNLCEKLDYRTSNTKLWKLAKQIDNLKPSNKETNDIISDNGSVSVDARDAAETLAQHYANESRLAFSSSNKFLARVTKDQTKFCRDMPADNPLFNVDFTLPELSYFRQNMDTNKSPGPDSIPVNFLTHLRILGRETLLYICNLSWKTGKIPRQWKSAIGIFPFLNPTRIRSYDKLPSYFSCLHYLQTNGMHGAEEIDSPFTHQ
ncbi:reverse transcriptase domain-containing protein [Trichonephila clavipes]|nr:reverse transcriptase domain-containing protein [Trichonephila clavipes]